jgi:site-specific recombinase XerD
MMNIDAFSELKRQFLSWLACPDEGQPYSAHTIRSYSQGVDFFLSFLKSNDITSMDDVTDVWIRAFARKLLDGGLIRASIKNKLSAVQLFWEVSLEFPKEKINPVTRYIEEYKRIKRGGRSPNRLIPILYTHQVDLLFDVVFSSKRTVSLRDLAIIGLLLDSGIRSDELCNLTRRALNDMLISDRLIVIGKGNKERTIKVLTSYKHLVISYLNSRQESDPCDYAFKTIQGTKMSQRSLYKMVSHYLKLADIDKPQMGGHLLRHTAASLMLHSGMNIKQVQSNLGHSSLITTDRYVHLM